MSGLPLRLSVALLTCLLGMGSSWLAGILRQALSPTALLTVTLVRPPDERRIAAESEALYQFVLEEVFVKDGVKLLVIQDHTTGCSVCEDPQSISGTSSDRKTSFDLAGKGFPEAQPATLKNYFERNQTSTKLKLEFGLSTRFQLIRVAEVDDIFRKDIGRGWRTFYSRYPKSSGLIFMSAVGFNSTYDEAMLYVGRQCDGLCGSGEYLLLRQTEGRWRIINRMPLWVS